MLTFSMNDLILALNPIKIIGGISSSVSSYSIDTRTLKKGDLFFAIKGDRHNGHHFISEAFQREACGVVFSDAVIPNEPVHRGQFAVQVGDTCRAFQDFANYFRKNKKIKVVGITGSNGKTTTKEWTHQLCSLKWKTHKTSGTKNNHIGVPQTLLNLKDEHEIAVIEMGMSGLGEIDRLAEIALPDFGVVTSVSASHMEQLKTIENVALAKKELVNRVDQNRGVIFLNGDDPRVLKMREGVSSKVILFGSENHFDYIAKNIRSRREGTTHFELRVPSAKFSALVQLPHLGRHNVYNCLAAIAVAHHLGMELKVLVEACSQLTSPPMRLEKIEREGILFINDAYNANPTSMEVALNVLEEIETEGKKIFVCGDMLELGMMSELAHQALGEKIYDSKIDVLITYGHLSRATAERAIACGMDEKDVFVCYEKQAIPNIIKDLASPGDVVLLKGSRRNQLENILEDWRGPQAIATVEK